MTPYEKPRPFAFTLHDLETKALPRDMHVLHLLHGVVKQSRAEGPGCATSFPCLRFSRQSTHEVVLDSISLSRPRKEQLPAHRLHREGGRRVAWRHCSLHVAATRNGSKPIRVITVDHGQRHTSHVSPDVSVLKLCQLLLLLCLCSASTSAVAIHRGF